MNEFVYEAPTTAVVPEMATEMPKASLEAPSVNSASWDQAVPARTNTYAAAPLAEPAKPSAPTARVAPVRATESPKSAPEAASDAVSSACWDQLVPERTNTYAAPVPELAPVAPTTAVDPAIVTETPKKSSSAAPGSAISACWDQLVPERTNTYPAPAKESLPSAPTTAVDPETATEPPKKSSGAPSEAVSVACWDQVVPERTNTYPAPAKESLPSAPTTAVDPETATE